jgi:hypothetical protein
MRTLRLYRRRWGRAHEPDEVSLFELIADLSVHRGRHRDAHTGFPGTGVGQRSPQGLALRRTHAREQLAS